MNANINEFKKRARNMTGKNHCFIDVIHGFYIPEMIFDILLHNEVTKSCIIYAGDECEKQLRGIISAKGCNIDIYDLYGDMVKVKDGIIEINSEVLIGRDNIIIWSANFVTDDIFHPLLCNIHNTPTFLIGDNGYYCASPYISSQLEHAEFFIGDTNKNPAFSLDVVYLNKRIRTGQQSKLEYVQHRAYDIKQCDLTSIPTEEYLKYDIVISMFRSPKDINNEIRDMYGFDAKPMVNERLINVAPFICNDIEGKPIYVGIYKIMRVLEIVNDNGLLFVVMELNGRMFRVQLNTQHLSMYTDCIPEDVIISDVGVKLEYCYVIPPLYALGKCFDNVLVLYSNGVYGSTRKSLYEVTTCPRKKLTIYTDEYYYIY